MNTEYPKARNLDGAYFRIERNGSWHNVAFTDLTSEEQDEILSKFSPEQLRSMCHILSDTLRYIGDKLNLEMEAY